MVFRAHKEDIHKQCNRIQNRRKDKDILEIARLCNDDIRNLIAR